MSGRSPRQIKEVQPQEYTISISGSMGSTGYTYVYVGATKYTAAATLTVEEKTVVEVTVGASSTANKAKCQVILNGEVVQSGAGTYNMVIRKPTSFVFARGDAAYYICTITTSDE